MKTLTYLDTLSFPIEYRIHDFVLTSTEQMIVLTDEGLYTYQDPTLQILQAMDASYHELQWVEETTLCIGSFAYNREPQTNLFQYALDTQELSTLYTGEFPIFDIAVADICCSTGSTHQPISTLLVSRGYLFCI